MKEGVIVCCARACVVTPCLSRDAVVSVPVVVAVVAVADDDILCRFLERFIVPDCIVWSSSPPPPPPDGNSGR